MNRPALNLRLRQHPRRGNPHDGFTPLMLRPAMAAVAAELPSSHPTPRAVRRNGRLAHGNAVGNVRMES